MEENTDIPDNNSAEMEPEQESQNIIQSSAIDMEVHHHPDLHHKKKKFTEYFLEFLMIFLAVTLGFFAESLRENISDSNKEHEYMQSLLNDLRTDSLKMIYVLSDNRRKSNKLDSLMQLSVKDLSDGHNRLLLYKYAGYSGFYSIFKSNDATMLQLKNSGGLRVIKKDHVADSIARYDYEVKIIYAAEDLYNSATSAAINAAHQTLDYSFRYDTSYYKNDDFTGKTIPLLTDEVKKQKLFFNEIDFEKGAVDNYNRNIEIRLPFLQSLISFLKKQYNLQ